MFDGSTQTFEKLARRDTVGIIPVTPDGKILLIEEEQPGKAKFWSIAGGQIDSGESVYEAAVRELREETGCVASEWMLWDAVQPLSKIEWAIYTYVARGCRVVGSLQTDAGERITVRPVSFEELIELVMHEGLSEWVLLTEKILRAKLKTNGVAELKKVILGQ